MHESYLDSVRESLYDGISYQIDSSEDEVRTKSKTKQVNRGAHSGKSKSNDANISRKKEKSVKAGSTKTKKKVRTSIVTTDFNILPSTSEHPDLTSKKNKKASKKRKKTLDKFESDESFDFNTYYSSREQSFNESIIEPHSGIDYEFPKTSKTIAKIKSRKIYETNKVKKIVKKKRKKTQTKTTKLIEKTSNNVCKSNAESQTELIEETQSSKTNIIQSDTPLEKNNETSTIQSDPSSEALGKKNETSIIQSDTSNEAVEKNNETSKANCIYFDRPEYKLVILEENQSVPCHGFCLLQVLHGELEILGYTLTRSHERVPFYSPRGSSLLVITNVTKEETNKTAESVRTTLNKVKCLKDCQIKKTTAAFICTEVKLHDIIFLEKHISQQIFPKSDNTNSPRIILDPKEQFNVININPKWDSIIDSVTSLTKLLIIGGKGVGKSTFTRYTINKLLTRFEKIKVIDLDPGQSEFTLPGCISVITVTEPILGPNYTHLQKPERSYLSNINIGHDPKKYVKCVKTLMENVSHKEDVPIVINYMGFVQGIGINIISAAITFIRPTDVVQINSVSHKKNFRTDITPKNVQEHCRLFDGDLSSAKGMDFNLIKISSSSDDINGWSLEPRQVRDMCVLAYFGKLMDEQTDCLTSENVPVYKISLSNINIVDDQGNKIPAAAVNANMVALATYMENSEFFRIVGHGIVKGIDVKTETLYLITPETFDTLKHVFYLVLTSVYLPPSVYMTSKDVSGCIPYVMEGEYESLGRITKRSYVPINKK